jgi:hypothetical protein
MATNSIKVPRDDDLTWFLCEADSALGATSTFREGGGGSGARDYERRITDHRFGGLTPLRAADGDVSRARRLRTAWGQLDQPHRDALALVYYHAPLTKTAVAAAYNLETAQAVDRTYGGLAGLALLLVAEVGEGPRVRKRNFDDLARCGAWRTPQGLAVVALCLSACGCKKATEAQGGKPAALAVVCGKHELEGVAAAALAGALAAWWALPKPVERYVVPGRRTVAA